MKSSFLTLSLLIYALTLSAQSPNISNHAVLENNGQFNKFEIGITLANLPPGLNPYNPDEISIEAEFITNTSSGTQTYHQYGFFYRDFEFMQSPPACNQSLPVNQNEFLSPKPNSMPWRVRFAPPTTGQWYYKLTLYINGVYADATVPSVGPISVSSSSNRGYISINQQQGVNGLEFGNYIFSNGDSYFPTGTNLDWYSKSYCADHWDRFYITQLNKLHEVGANYARLMAVGDGWGNRLPLTVINDHPDPLLNGNPIPLINGFIFGIEWGMNNVLGNYNKRQNFAFLLDKLIEKGENDGIYYQLPLTGWGETEDNNPVLWACNPYNFIDPDPEDFYTNQTSIDFFKRRLRYIVSRWGYSTNIFAWEIMNEGDLGNTSQVNRPTWFTIMKNELQTLDNSRHLITTSTGTEYHDYNLGSTTNQIYQIFDFISHHNYQSTSYYNFAQFRRDAGLLKAQHFNKPFFASEFGKTFKHGDYFLREHDGAEETNHNEFHNTIWSSSFSGQSGTSASWDRQIFNMDGHSTTSYRHIIPLRTLINQVDFENEYFESISTECDIPTLNHLNMSQSAYNFFSDPNVYGAWFTDCPYPTSFRSNIRLIEPPGATYPTTGSLASKVLILGLRSKSNIYGWIHKKDNFWWKVPHQGSNLNGKVGLMTAAEYDENCAYNGFGGASPANAAACGNAPLANVDAVFENVCNGEYTLDYYSTYSNRIVEQNGQPVDGGIIPSFSRRVFTGNRELHIKLPILMPLSDDEVYVNAPDYGYHLKKVEPENYADIPISGYTQNEEIKPGTLEASLIQEFYPKVFFIGEDDDFIHMYWYNPPNNDWIHKIVGTTPASNEKADGDLVNAANSGYLFYRGMDARLHYYKYTGGTPDWQHGCLTPGCSSSVFVANNANLAATDEQVFYKDAGNDKLNMYYFNGTSWNQMQLNSSATTSENVGAYIAVPAGGTTSTDDVFFLKPNKQIAMYSRNGAISNPWMFSDIAPSSPPFGQDVLSNSKILPAYVNGDLYVFYISSLKQVQYYKNISGTWIHGTMGTISSWDASTGSHLHFANNVLYYFSSLGGDNIQRYYWDGVEWRHAYIAPCDANKPQDPDNLEDFRMLPDGNIFYADPSNNMRMLWNKRDCEECSGTYSIPLHKPARPKSSDINSVDNNLIGNLAEVSNPKSGAVTRISYSNEKKVMEALLVYPNPATKMLNIAYKNIQEPLVFNLINNLGQSVKTFTMDNNTKKHEIPVSDLVRGLYFIQIKNQSGKIIATEKISLF